MKAHFFPAYQLRGTPRIRQNAWGNWYGYIGNTRVIAFANTIPGSGMEEEAQAWLKEMQNEQASEQEASDPAPLRKYSKDWEPV